MKKNQIERENIYKSSSARHKNIYPSEVIISWVKNNYGHLSKSATKKIKCLDFGCGWGNNLYFLKKEGFDCYGIDLSETAIKHLYPDFVS